MKINKALLAAILAVGGSGFLLQAADAQVLDSLRNRTKSKDKQDPTQQTQQPRRTALQGLEPAESAAVMPLYQAVQAQDWPTAQAALPAARAGATTPAGRYLVAQLTLEIGRGTQNVEMQGDAVDAMVASGGAPAELMPQLLSIQADRAVAANNLPLAESALTRVIELDPNNVARIRQLAQVKNALNKKQEALTLYRRAIQLSETGGQRAPEDMMRGALAIAYEARQLQPSLELGRALVTAYPSPANWRSALRIYRELAGSDPGLALDLRRLMRAAGALESERDFVEYADDANSAGLPGEAKAVLEEAFSGNRITTAQTYARNLLTLVDARIAEDRAALPGLRTRALAPGGSGREARVTGDVYYSYGQYADAATLYRAALQKGGEDPNLVNTRLGAALAMGGQRAEAETAFRAITGPRSELAQFWLMWLATRG